MLMAGLPRVHWHLERRTFEAWRRITDFVHQHTQAKMAIQIGHAGPKGATLEPWKWDPKILDEPFPKTNSGRSSPRARCPSTPTAFPGQ